jgi:hypothetical protein
MAKLINLIPANQKPKANESLEDMEVALPSKVEKFLQRLVQTIKSYNLPKKKEQAVIARVMDSMGITTAELSQAVQKLKKYDVVKRQKTGNDDHDWMGESLNEATLIKSGKEDLRKTDLKKDDLIYFHTSENERGMSMYTGTIIGRVSKVVGSKNVEVTAIGPASKKGDVYKVERREALLLPRKGKKIGITAGYDYGAGSGSQGQFDYEGVVTDVDLNSATLSIKGDGDKKAVKIQLKDIAKAFYLYI